MFRRELLFILPLIVSVTVGQTDGGYSYYGSSNVRYQGPQLNYGQKLLVLPGRPMTAPATVTAAPAAQVPVLDGPLAPAAPPAPAVPANAPVFLPRPIYSPAYRPLLSPRPTWTASVVVAPPHPPTTTALLIRPVEAVQPQHAVEQPEPVQPLAPESIQPSVETELIPQPAPIPDPIAPTMPVSHPEPVPQPKLILEPGSAPLPEPAVPAYAPVHPPQPIYSPAYRPLLPPRLIWSAPVVNAPPLPPATATSIIEVIQPEPAMEQPEPAQPPAPELIQPSVEPEPISQPMPIPEPIAQPEPVALPEFILEPVPAPLPEPAAPAYAPVLPPRPIYSPAYRPLLPTRLIWSEPPVNAPPQPPATAASTIEMIQPEPALEQLEPAQPPAPEVIQRSVEPEPIPQPMPFPEPIVQPKSIAQALPVSLPEPIAEPILAPLPEPIALPLPAPQPELIAQPVPEVIQEISPAQEPTILPQRDEASLPKPQQKPVNNFHVIVPQFDKPVALAPLLPKRENIRPPAFGRHTLPPTNEYPSETQATQTSSYSYPTPPRTVVTKAPTVFTEQTYGSVVITRQPNPPVTKSPGQFQFAFQCKEGNGYYSVEHECDTFIECKQDRPMKFTCLDGLHFNPAAKLYEYPCAYPSEVKCVAGDQEQNPMPSDTCPNQYGFYSMNDGDCSNFIMCQEGLATVMDCPIGLAFNPQTSSCDWPANVPQCNPNVFKDFTCPDPPQDENGEISDIIYKYSYGGQCKLYIACQLGHPRLLSCERGLAYDDASQSCIDEDYVADCTLPDLQNVQ